MKKLFGWLCAGILVFIPLFAAWLFVTTRGDNELNPDIAAFERIDEEAYMRNNGNLAMLGLAAPASVENTYDWALQVSQEQIRAARAARPQRKGDDAESRFRYYHELFSGVSTGSRAYDKTSGKLELKGPENIGNKLSCVLNQGWQESGAAANCARREDVAQWISDNAALLKRYQAALGYSRFVELPENGMTHGKLMIDAQELYLASLASLSEQYPDGALAEWVRDMAFYKRALNDQINLITRSIVMVNYGMAQRLLPALIKNNPVLAKTHEAELRQLLAPFGPQDIDIKLTAQMEYHQYAYIWKELGNYSQNRIYRLEQDFTGLWLLPPAQLEAAKKRFEAKYRRDRDWNDKDVKAMGIACRFISLACEKAVRMVTDTMLSGFSIGSDLVVSMHAADARSRLLNLYVQIKANTIPGNRIAAFLNQSPRELFNPFTEKPFVYDAATKSICFEWISGNPEGRYCLLAE